MAILEAKTFRYVAPDIDKYFDSEDKQSHSLAVEETDNVVADLQKQQEPGTTEPRKAATCSKKKRSRSSDDREVAALWAKKYIDQRQTNKRPYTLHEAATTIKPKLSRDWSLRTIKSWIGIYFPDEAKYPGRPSKEKVKK